MFFQTLVTVLYQKKKKKLVHISTMVIKNRGNLIAFDFFQKVIFIFLRAGDTVETRRVRYMF